MNDLSKKTIPVSVVVPCWRCQDTIERALDSVLGQTVLPQEVILVDDASADGTLDFLRALAGKYPAGWVKVIGLTTNGGPGLARNAAWDAATAPYLAFLDADDAWHPAKLELQYDWMVQHPDYAMTGHGTELVQAGQDVKLIQQLGEPVIVSLKEMLISCRFPTRSVMLKRELPFRFQGRAYTEDYLMWLQIIAAGHSCARFAVPLAWSYRPEFSEGGYSGQLWVHEKRELNALAWLRKTGGLSWPVWLVSSVWSWIKYVRRVLIARQKNRTF